MASGKRKPRQDQTCVAITGTSGPVGSNLLAALIKDGNIKRIIAIDEVKPRFKNRKVQFEETDITDSKAVDEISEALARYNCKTVVHAALPDGPSRNEEATHELQVMGSMHLLLACESADVDKVILTSTTEVYGALPDNPNFLNENHPSRGGLHNSFLRDKIDAEKQFIRFQKRFPKKVVTILRSCTILGPDISDSRTHFLTQPSVPTVLGFDPLMQFIHINDVVRAFVGVIKSDFPGIFNLVGEGVLPLSRVLKISGKVNLPSSPLLLYSAAQILWYLNIGLAPASHIDFIKYHFVADGAKAEKVMKFRPVYSSQEALLSLKRPPPQGGERVIRKGR